MVPLALDDIQGDILQGYGFTYATYLFYTVPDSASGHRFLSETLPDVTTAENWGQKPKTTVNVALTFAGLRALAVPATVLDALPVAFREPISRRAQRLLGDTGESAPDRWDLGLGTGSAHVLLMLNGTVDNAGRFEDAVTAVAERARRHGLPLAACRQDAKTLPKRREHFGWSDGFSQPSIEGTGRSRPGQGVPQDDGVTWRDLKAGEFIHGYPDEDGQITSGPTAPLLRNGTFMVYRKLRQDVALFRRVLREEATRYAATVSPAPEPDGDQFYELIAAKVVGRWRDGMALELQPHRPPAESRNLGGKAEEGHDNDFRYWAGDRDGMICPKGAHIRRANPRDALGGSGIASRRHRIIRRGMPYGRRLKGRQDDGQPRGLIFVCFNACIERQFEVIQAQWCNDGDAFRLGDDKDYLLGDGQGTGKFTIEGRPPYFARAQPRVVLTRGCEYLLMPGIRALRTLATP